ncbi:NAD(P)/FAD-dependent oxidoreductase [Microseira wollei]|uniref:FAD dependent oxidoreductase n=1 Tax=Microseira wollei NIES-4236 TaxID=2530354 RepID=A0AAV3XBC6_9CYAN|nr:FAD-dependent oxidoreductase [Microseira wollei]GET37405.1 FAD dependent oxidoreductase [Microseira wollei NIES-4236]
MSRITIIGCGVVGAAIAYELSLIPGLSITVLDKQLPAQGATSAALGVLMGIISQKIKGKAWQLRQTSLQRYETLIPELEANTNRQILYNRLGILMLVPSVADWENLVEIRQSQGWHLEIWDIDQVLSKCPQLNLENITAAIYSPQDRQLDPSGLTLALVEAAGRNSVNFKFGVTVEEITSTGGICYQIETSNGQIETDWIVISAGLGSTPITASLAQKIDIQPVLGQALHLRLENPLGNSDFQPVITSDDIHIVPVGDQEYWVGATVEFPTDAGEVVADPSLLDKVMAGAIAFCPPLSQATILRTWSGLRPRPQGYPAPIIGQLPGYNNILLATGHYRNGVLLAPATAIAIRDAILAKSGV